MDLLESLEHWYDDILQAPCLRRCTSPSFKNGAEVTCPFLQYHTHITLILKHCIQLNNMLMMKASMNVNLPCKLLPAGEGHGRKLIDHEPSNFTDADGWHRISYHSDVVRWSFLYIFSATPLPETLSLADTNMEAFPQCKFSSKEKSLRLLEIMKERTPCACGGYPRYPQVFSTTLLLSGPLTMYPCACPEACKGNNNCSCSWLKWVSSQGFLPRTAEWCEEAFADFRHAVAKVTSHLIGTVVWHSSWLCSKLCSTLRKKSSTSEAGWSLTFLLLA